jgi:hypothetical protein
MKGLFWWNLILSFWILAGRLCFVIDICLRLHIPIYKIFIIKQYHLMLVDAGFYGYFTPLLYRILKGPIPPKP